jgi:hypothetical protein
MYILIFYTTVTEILAILRRFQLDMFRSLSWFPCKVPVTLASFFNETIIYSTDFLKILEY